MLELNKGKTETRIKFVPFDYHSLAKVKSLPERRYEPNEKAWYIPNWELGELQKLFPKEEVPEADKYERVVEMKIKKSHFTIQPYQLPVRDKRLDRMLYLKRARDVFTIQKILEDKNFECTIEGYKPRKGFKGFEKLPTLYDFQREAVDDLKEKGSGLLSLDMGLGKTPTSLVYAHEMGFESIIILAPSALLNQWNKELKKLFGYHDAVVISGKVQKQKRLELYKNPVVIASYDIIKNDIQEIYENGEKLHFDCLIMDEVQKVKNWKTKRAEAINNVVAEFVVGLTGTPVENKLEELYSIVDQIVPAYFGGFRAFADRYLRRDTWGSVIGYKNIEEVYAELSGVMFRRLKSEVNLQLPTRVEIERCVEMNSIEKKIYKEIGKRGNDLGTLAELKVCASNPCMKGYNDISSKEKALKELLEDELSNRKVVIFTQYKKNVKRLVRITEEIGFESFYLYGGMGDKLQETVDAFDESENSILIMTDVGQYGLNLQTADVLINFDLPWNPSYLKQRAGRIERIGSEHESILIVNMISSNTIDEYIVQLLGMKQRLSDITIDDAKIDLQTGEPLEEIKDLQLSNPEGVEEAIQKYILMKEYGKV